MEDILDETGYVSQLEADSEEEAKARVENIDELISKVVAYEEESAQPSLSGFLEEVALVADIDNVDPATDKVLLMTLHSAKGLEFNHVYLSGMEDGVFPSYMTIMSDDSTEVEEERRLAYVGITRAKLELTISAAKQRMLRGETQYNPVSRFVKEIPQELLDNRLPVYKRDFSDYEDTSSERVSFKQKPYSFTAPSSGKIPVYGGVAAPKASASAGASGTSYGPMGVRPKAVLTKKTTPSGVKPFIAQVSDMNKKPGVAINYTVGDRVRHSRFGDGSVLAMEPGPKDTKVTVQFDGCGQKIMYATFAKLVKI